MTASKLVGMFVFVDSGDSFRTGENHRRDCECYLVQFHCVDPGRGDFLVSNFHPDPMGMDPSVGGTFHFGFLLPRGAEQ
jgi:hypothetical protein